MPASDQLITDLPRQAPSAVALFLFIEDPAGTPAARACNGNQLIQSSIVGGNIRYVNGYQEILVEGLDEYYQICSRLNDDGVPEIYLNPPTVPSGEGGELLGGEGGEAIGQE